MTTHTPGPWARSADNSIFYISPEIESIADCYAISPGTPGTAEANARLIAAAPDLLAALEDCYRLLSTIRQPVKDSDYYIVTNAAAAIAKATGGDA